MEANCDTGLCSGKKGLRVVLDDVSSGPDCLCALSVRESLLDTNRPEFLLIGFTGLLNAEDLKRKEGTGRSNHRNDLLL